MSTGTVRSYHLTEGEGTPMAWFEAKFQLKASDEQIGFMELAGSPEGG